VKIRNSIVNTGDLQEASLYRLARLWVKSNPRQVPVEDDLVPEIELPHPESLTKETEARGPPKLREFSQDEIDNILECGHKPNLTDLLKLHVENAKRTRKWFNVVRVMQ